KSFSTVCTAWPKWSAALTRPGIFQSRLSLNCSGQRSYDSMAVALSDGERNRALGAIISHCATPAVAEAAASAVRYALAVRDAHQLRAKGLSISSRTKPCGRGSLRLRESRARVKPT